MLRNQDPRGGFRLPEIKIEADKKGLASQAGLPPILSLFDESFGERFASCLPKNGSNRSTGNYKLSLLLIASLLSGHDCLDDIRKFDDDPLIEHLFKGKLPTAKTLGNFLRRFSIEEIEALRLFLTQMGYTLRDHSTRIHPHKGNDLITFKIDTTPHEQHGAQAEGCGWMTTSKNKHVYGLASQTIFDELGFCYTGELLPASKPRGNTVKLLDQVLNPLKAKKLKTPFEKVAHISGDSAYLNEHTLMCIDGHHCTFTISAPNTIRWQDQVPSRTWEPWVYTEEQIAKAEKRGKSLPECYLARWHWTPSWSMGKLKFPVVIKKEWRADEVQGLDCGFFHYHAVATNQNLFHTGYQKVIEDYKPRADVENMIREFKLNFDAKNLPCLSLMANEVYLLFVLIAQNLVRWVALIDEPDRPHFAKKIRDKLIISPGRVLTGSRQFVLRVKEKFKREVDQFLEAWRSQPVRVPLYFSTA